MEIKVVREVLSTQSSVGRMYIDDVFYYFTLEDRDRGLTKEMPLETIKETKQKGITAIPLGRYEVTINWSDRFGKRMPILLGVPGFDGIRIHAGNKPEDTLGCILIGMRQSNNPDEILASKMAYDDFFRRLDARIKLEKAWITIVKK